MNFIISVYVIEPDFYGNLNFWTWLGEDLMIAIMEQVNCNISAVLTGYNGNTLFLLSIHALCTCFIINPVCPNAFTMSKT